MFTLIARTLILFLQMLSVVNTLKDRCYELHDEVGAGEDLVGVLRTGLVSSINQIDSLYASVLQVHI